MLSIPFKFERIVQKVSQLMALCDQLEAALEARAVKQERLVQRALKGVFEGADVR